MANAIASAAAPAITLASVSQAEIDAIIAYHTELNGDPGDDPRDPVNVSAFMEAWEDDPSMFVEDYDAWRESLSATSAPAPAAAAPAPAPVVESSDDIAKGKKAVHDAAVAEIVGMIRAKYEDEGQRNFAIGKRAFEHAWWQKGNFPGQYLNSDFDALMNDIRVDVRMWVPIKAESIQIAHWVRCHVLRELVAKEIGRDGAESLTMFEYKALVGKALHFTVADLEGDLNPCWLDMIRTVVADRATGTRVPREDFENRIASTIQRAAAAKMAALDPVAAAAKVATDKVRANAAKVAKTTKDITSSVNDGIASGAITPEGALAILEGVAKHHGKPLVAASVGFDPTNCTVADCETLAAAMFAAGKLAEMRALAAKLAKGIATMEKAAAAVAAAAAPAAAAA